MEAWERLLEELRAEFLLREEELELLHEIDLRILDANRPLDATFSFIVERTQTLLKSDHTHILLKRGGQLETVYSSSGTDIGQRFRISDSLTGQCLSNSAMINVADLSATTYRERYVPIEGYQGPPIVSLLAVPIRVHDTTIGVLNLESARRTAFAPVQGRMATAIAAQVGIALQRAQTFDHAALFAEVDQLLFADIGSDTVLQAALEKVMASLERLQHVELRGAQILFPQGMDALEIVHSTNPADIGLSVPIHGSVSGRAVRERRVVVVGDVSKDTEYRRMLGSAIQSEIAVPIILGDDVVIGVLNVESEELDVFSGFYELVLSSFADKVKTLLALTKLRSDVTEALELGHANDLLIAVGDQASNMVHRINNTVGAMRVRIRELQGMQQEGSLEQNDFLTSTLDSLLALADRTLEMPQEVARFLSQHTDMVNMNDCVVAAVRQVGVPDNIVVDLTLGEGIPSLPLYCFDIVVQNLIQNAVDAMPDGGRLAVSTSLVAHPELPAGYMQLHVRDTGVGIPHQVRDRVFALNFTTKREKTGKGLGLGLWWVRNFVRRAKGDITIASGLDVGTEFIVKIPVDRSRDPLSQPNAWIPRRGGAGDGSH